VISNRQGKRGVSNEDLVLDGDGHWLSRAMQQCRGTGLIIAINTGKSFAHLPWEVLHNDK
jgi:hypothetical protein